MRTFRLSNKTLITCPCSLTNLFISSTVGTILSSLHIQFFLILTSSFSIHSYILLPGHSLYTRVAVSLLSSLLYIQFSPNSHPTHFSCSFPFALLTLRSASLIHSFTILTPPPSAFVLHIHSLVYTHPIHFVVLALLSLPQFLLSLYIRSFLRPTPVAVIVITIMIVMLRECPATEVRGRTGEIVVWAV